MRCRNINNVSQNVFLFQKSQQLGAQCFLSWTKPASMFLVREDDFEAIFIHWTPTPGSNRGRSKWNIDSVRTRLPHHPPNIFQSSSKPVLAEKLNAQKFKSFPFDSFWDAEILSLIYKESSRVHSINSLMLNLRIPLPSGGNCPQIG